MVFGVVGCNNLRDDRLANRLPVSNVVALDVALLDDEMLSSLVDVVVVVIVGVE